MKEEKLPTRFFIEPENEFSNGIIHLNNERGTIVASEERIQYKKEFLSVWEVDLKALRLLWKSRASIPGFKFRVYAKINDQVQSWQLLDSQKKARVAKARKVLRKIGQRKIAAKRQPPIE